MKRKFLVSLQPFLLGMSVDNPGKRLFKWNHLTMNKLVKFAKKHSWCIQSLFYKFKMNWCCFKTVKLKNTFARQKKLVLFNFGI